MWDAVAAWLLAHLATFAGLTDSTYDGTPLTQDQLLDYAAVGAEDPGGSYQQDYDGVQGLIQEIGEVSVRFVSRSGDDDLGPHRATTKAWVDRLRDDIAADLTLGGLLLEGSTIALGQVDVRQQKEPGGVRVERAVTVRYLTRL